MALVKLVAELTGYALRYKQPTPAALQRTRRQLINIDNGSVALSPANHRLQDRCSNKHCDDGYDRHDGYAQHVHGASSHPLRSTR